MFTVCLQKRLAHSERPNRSEMQTAWHQSMSRELAPTNVLLFDGCRTHYCDGGSFSLEVSCTASDWRRRCGGEDVENWIFPRVYLSLHLVTWIIMQIKFSLLFELIVTNLEPPKYWPITCESLSLPAVHNFPPGGVKHGHDHLSKLRVT